MAVSELLYEYPAPSSCERVEDRTELTLATSGGTAPSPHLFSGFLGSPLQTARALLVVAEVARTRYYTPPAMKAAQIAAADPVVTSNLDELRFESFSACCGVYCRLDLSAESLDDELKTWGTTNVDFNPPMRAALSQVTTDDAMLMRVGHDEVSLATTTGSAVEKKVPLPTRWLKGFAEVQVAAAGMVPVCELDPGETRRFVRSLPRDRNSRGTTWAVPTGKGLRLSQRPADSGVCAAGPQRLRLLDRLLPFATGLRVYGPPASSDSAQPSAWELVLDGARLVFVLSPDASRGFSGEAGVLIDLAFASEGVSDQIAGALHGESVIDPDAVARALSLTRIDVRAGLAELGAAGRVGYDLHAPGYFHRDLPFDRSALEGQHPRLRDARKLVDAEAVTFQGIDVALVQSGDVDYRVRFTPQGVRCTCPWYAKYGEDRGPCKHALAARLVRDHDRAASPSARP